jgi:hypothetical protein
MVFNATFNNISVILLPHMLFYYYCSVLKLQKLKYYTVDMTFTIKGLGVYGV